MADEKFDYKATVIPTEHREAVVNGKGEEVGFTQYIVDRLEKISGQLDELVKPK